MEALGQKVKMERAGIKEETGKKVVDTVSFVKFCLKA